MAINSPVWRLDVPAIWHGRLPVPTEYATWQEAVDAFKWLGVIWSLAQIRRRRGGFDDASR